MKIFFFIGQNCTLTSEKKKQTRVLWPRSQLVRFTKKFRLLSPENTAGKYFWEPLSLIDSKLLIPSFQLLLRTSRNFEVVLPFFFQAEMILKFFDVAILNHSSHVNIPFQLSISSSLIVRAIFKNLKFFPSRN